MRPLTQDQLEADLAALGIGKLGIMSNEEIIYEFILEFCRKNKKACRPIDVMNENPDISRNTISGIISTLVGKGKLHNVGRYVGYVPKGIA